MAAHTKTTTPKKVLRRRDIEDRLKLSRSTIYGKLTFNPNRPNEYDPEFPRPISLGAGAVGWLEHEIDAWLDAQAAKRDAEGGIRE